MTADVKNGAGTAVAPATREFLTDAGEFKVSLTAWKGDTQVTELSQLSDGDSITVKAQVVNTAGKAQDLLIIYAGYNGQLMTAYQGAERQIAADERNKLIDDIAISVDTDLLSAIRIFGWDNYDSLQPLAIPCEIK